MKASATKTGITLKLTDDDALLLCAVLGRVFGPIANWYDPIADVVEGKTATFIDGPDGPIETYTAISYLVDQNPAASEQRLRIQS